MHAPPRTQRARTKHDEVSVQAVQDVAHVGVVAWLRALHPDELHDLMLTLHTSLHRVSSCELRQGAAGTTSLGRTSPGALASDSTTFNERQYGSCEHLVRTKSRRCLASRSMNSVSTAPHTVRSRMALPECRIEGTHQCPV